MSIAVMTLCWKVQGISGTQKLVLVALADNANDQGECYPSVTMLMDKCSLSERGVQAAISGLEKEGHVTRILRVGKSTVYRVHPRTTRTPAEYAPQHSVHPTPAPDAPPPPHDAHPTPARRAPITINEPSLEPSVNRHKEKFDPMAELQANGVTAETARDWLTLRKGKKAPVTATALKQICAEAGKAGVSLEQALQTGCARGWVGFKAEWVQGQRAQAPPGASNANEEAKRLLGITQGDVIDV